jgi:hypothetical protein
MYGIANIIVNVYLSSSQRSKYGSMTVRHLGHRRQVNNR